MPTYTYRCSWCGAKVDRFHGMRDRPRVGCSKCGYLCKRIIAPGAGVVFRGSGFYETDYKRRERR